MSDTILAALIGALSSVAVAFIGRQTANREQLKYRSIPGRQLPTLPWVLTLVALALWLLISPGLVHHDLAGTNFLAIPVVLLILALASPIRPLTAGWVSLAIFSSNFVLGPLGNRLKGSRYDVQFGLEFDKLWPILLLGFVAAAIVAAVCAFRLRQSVAESSLQSSPGPGDREVPAVRENALADGLSRLAALHTEGKLSDDEFRAAKRRLLGDT